MGGVYFQNMGVAAPEFYGPIAFQAAGQVALFTPLFIGNEEPCGKPQGIFFGLGNLLYLRGHTPVTVLSNLM